MLLKRSKLAVVVLSTLLAGSFASEAFARCQAADGGRKKEDSIANLRIHDIQGASHVSPYEDCWVKDVRGVVTLVVEKGFHMEDPEPDESHATSEGIYVFLNEKPVASVGDGVVVSGKVDEFAFGKSKETDLRVTEISRADVRYLTNPPKLPPPVVLGVGGRIPPDKIIDNDINGVAEESGIYQPDEDGLDFFESLESMRVQVNDALVIGPRKRENIVVVGDNGRKASGLSKRGALTKTANDLNPERLELSYRYIENRARPVNVGDRVEPVRGVMTYKFGRSVISLTEVAERISGNLKREVTELRGDDQHVTVASFNVQNLAGNDPSKKYDGLARTIVDHMGSPNIVALIEMQDNNGSISDSVVDASRTFSRLTDAVVDAGGPKYESVWIDPLPHVDGGKPGGNIRVGLLYDPKAGLTMAFAEEGDAVTPVKVLDGGRLSHNPGRVLDPDHPHKSKKNPFYHTRKSLAVQFERGKRRFTVIVNHLSSKRGDEPEFGRHQPPSYGSEVRRVAQAKVIRDFVKEILKKDPQADVIVLGDFNDFSHSETVHTIAQAPMHDLTDSLPPEERYSFIYAGGAQALDHVLVSDHLYKNGRPQYDVVHVNCEFTEQISDHDPEVARFYLPR